MQCAITYTGIRVHKSRVNEFYCFTYSFIIISKWQMKKALFEVGVFVKLKMCRSSFCQHECLRSCLCLYYSSAYKYMPSISLIFQYFLSEFIFSKILFSIIKLTLVESNPIEAISVEFIEYVVNVRVHTAMQPGNFSSRMHCKLKVSK